MLAALLGGAEAAGADVATVSGRAMGTTWSVKFVQSSPPLQPDRIERSVAERLEQLEQLFSTYRPASELSRFNATQHTDWVPVARELAEVAQRSRELSELTDGAFDATVFPLVRLWGFGGTRRAGSLPTAAEIEKARAQVGWRFLAVRASPPALRKLQPGVAVDLSSMAKGFAADVISELLETAGVVNHLVQVGGDVKAGGAGPDGDGWRVAIERLPEDVSSPSRVVALRNRALSTSGDARNFFVAGGRRYGHIIDPRRGEPVAGQLASVSIVHASGASSSALATTLFVLGAEEGERFARTHRLACLFLLREGGAIVVRPTPEFEAMRK